RLLAILFQQLGTVRAEEAQVTVARQHDVLSFRFDRSGQEISTSVLPFADTKSFAAVRPNSRTTPAGPCPARLNYVHYDKDNHDQQDQPQSAARVVTPASAVGPRRQSSEQEQHKRMIRTSRIDVSES